MEALIVENLTKRYDRDEVLKDVSFKVDSGAFGLIGPNGAGKTTLIKIICGLLAPTSGRVLVEGRPPGSPKANAAIGYLSERQGYYEQRTPQAYLGFFGGLYGLSQQDIRERTRELLANVGLMKSASDPISTFSRGMRQRLGIARAMLHRPRIYILDEPLSGLDPTGRKEVMRILCGLKRDGSIIFLSSHELKDMDTLCDQILMLWNGKKIARGNPDSLISKIRGAREVLAFNLHSPFAELDRLPAEVPGILKFEVLEGGFQLTIPHDPALERRILQWLLDHFVDFSMKKHVIDSLYTHILEESSAAGEADHGS
jgi:ABC-2 type transport system ATP-binding protein